MKIEVRDLRDNLLIREHVTDDFSDFTVVVYLDNQVINDRFTRIGIHGSPVPKGLRTTVARAAQQFVPEGKIS